MMGQSRNCLVFLISISVQIQHTVFLRFWLSQGYTIMFTQNICSCNLIPSNYASYRDFVLRSIKGTKLRYFKIKTSFSLFVLVIAFISSLCNSVMICLSAVHFMCVYVHITVHCIWLSKWFNPFTLTSWYWHWTWIKKRWKWCGKM